MTHKTGRFVLFLFLISFFACPAPLWASDSTDPGVSPGNPSAPSEISYGEGTGRKLSRGIGNVAFGWLDIPKSIEDAGENENFVAALTLGPIRGVSHAVGRTLAGVYDVATFPLPAPGNFEPLVRPEYVIAPEGAGERHRDR